MDHQVSDMDVAALTSLQQQQQQQHSKSRRHNLWVPVAALLQTASRQHSSSCSFEIKGTSIFQPV
jgi:hypothetical protein